MTKYNVNGDDNEDDDHDYDDDDGDDDDDDDNVLFQEELWKCNPLLRPPPPAPAPCFQSPLYSTVQLSLSQGNVPNDPMWNDFVTALSKETGRTVQDLNTLGEFYTDSLVQDLNTQVSFTQTGRYRTSTH